MGDQQHSAVLPPADLLDDVEVFLDLQGSDALRRQLHQLVDGADVSEAQFDHLHGRESGSRTVSEGTGVQLVPGIYSFLKKQRYCSETFIARLLVTSSKDVNMVTEGSRTFRDIVPV